MLVSIKDIGKGRDRSKIFISEIALHLISHLETLSFIKIFL